MTAKSLMVLGAIGGAVLATLSILSPHGIDDVIMVVTFAFGAICGKGYGIWEERNR